MTKKFEPGLKYLIGCVSLCIQPQMRKNEVKQIKCGNSLLAFEVNFLCSTRFAVNGNEKLLKISSLGKPIFVNTQLTSG